MTFLIPPQKIKIKINQKIHLKLGIGVLALFLLLPSVTQARTFNPHNIITDQQLFDKNSLSQTAIQKFLERENSVLSRYSQIVNGQPMKASEIIWQVGQKHSINPKFLLTTLEKEQGLVTRSQATEKALDWATGYGCYGGGCKEKHRGFFNQVEASAETQQIYKQKASQFSFRVGQTTTSYDGYKITPANQATANLYIYTPYVGNAPELGISLRFGANKLFWRIWHRYFSDQKFLDGQIITFNGSYYKIKNNATRKFLSRNLFLKDYQLTDAINVSSKDINAYPGGPTLNFSNNTLVKSSASGQIYLIFENAKRPVIDNSALALLNEVSIAMVTSNDIPTVSESQLAGYALGTLISSSSIFPQGKLFKDPAGQIWQVKDSLKHAVDSVVWQNNFKSSPAEPITTEVIKKYPTGKPVKLKDGTFVTINGKYYLISSGERMKIEDLTIFNRVFSLSKKNSALRISSALLDVHDAGEIIDYIDDTIQDSAPTVTTISSSGNYGAIFDSMVPNGLIMLTGQTAAVTIKFNNTGSTSWNVTNVWLEIKNKDKTASSFSVPSKVTVSENSVARGQIGSFAFDLTAPTDQSGLLNQEFILYYNKNGTPTKITSIGKFIIVKSGDSAQIIEHNIPIAVSNLWRPIDITIKIKNTSADTAWLSRKTALELYNLDGETSYFYDPNDWVREEVVGVPLNGSTIEPGEIAEFKFTLDPRNIKPNHYILNFQLRLLDQEKDVFLNGRTQWHREIRVD